MNENTCKIDISKLVPGTSLMWYENGKLNPQVVIVLEVKGDQATIARVRCITDNKPIKYYSTEPDGEYNIKLSNWAKIYDGIFKATTIRLYASTGPSEQYTINQKFISDHNAQFVPSGQLVCKGDINMLLEQAELINPLA